VGQAQVGLEQSASKQANPVPASFTSLRALLQNTKDKLADTSEAAGHITGDSRIQRAA
jgi:hypothetical protein